MDHTTTATADAYNAADDMLTGIPQIAAYIGSTVRRTEYSIEKGCLPAFVLNGRWRMRKSTYLRFIAQLEAAAMAGPRGEKSNVAAAMAKVAA